MIKVVLFDLDETLYPRSSKLMSLIGQRIDEYVIDKIGIPAAKADEIRRHWRTHYGTALRGLIEEGYPVDVEDYLCYVHNIPLDGFIAPQPELRAMLLSIPLRRAILTNSNREHAIRGLSHMNLLDCFEQIIDVRALSFINKPDPLAYDRAMSILGVNPGEVIFVEDTPVNTRAAKKLGIATILVDCPPSQDADFTVASVLDVGDVILKLVRDGTAPAA